MGAPRSFAHTANADRIGRIDISRSTLLHRRVFRTTESLAAITKFLAAITKSWATLNAAPLFSVPTSVILPDASARRAT